MKKLKGYWKKLEVEGLTIFYEFFDIKCYPPSEDSFLLLEFVKKYSKNKKVLDMGCGSGIQGLIAYKYGAKSVLFSDIDENCIKLAKLNYIYNFIKKDGPIDTFKNLDKYSLNLFVVSDLFKKIDGKFDLIVFNPPYLPEDRIYDIQTTGGKEGNEIIIRFLSKAYNYLTINGKILLIMSSLSNPKKVIRIFDTIYKFRLLKKERFFFEELYLYEISL